MPLAQPGRSTIHAFLSALLLAITPTLTRAATLEVGAGKPYPVPSAAAAAAHDGDHIAIAAGSYSDCAIWRANDLTIEGAGPEATIITGTPCEGKSLFITRGNGTTIRDLALTDASVADSNGAGIRVEGGNLTIDHVRFAHDENGILSGSLPGINIIIRNSEFVGNGTCKGGGGCAHGVYVGDIALLRVEHSRFFETREGHHIKSRAQRTEVIGCDISDGLNGTASLSVDVPNGGAVLLRDNHIQKGPKSENHSAALMIGEEGVTRSTPEIIVDHNTFVVDGTYKSYLVFNLTATEAVLTGNTLQGNALPFHGDGILK